MNDVFIYLSGLEILTKMLKHLSIFICLIGFSFNSNAQFGFSHEVGYSWTCGFSGLWTAI
jgi:hypothetical protein